MSQVSLKHLHPSWKPIIEIALQSLDKPYWQHLETNQDWLPGMPAIFNAFSLPLDKTQYILFGESPYPRKDSANGFAFWDAAVSELWSDTGLSKSVNRATSLRNFMKMLLVSEKFLSVDKLSQENIADLKKDTFVKTIHALFKNFLDNGVLLLNASLVYDDQKVSMHAKKWQPFMKTLLEQLANIKPNIQLILFGNLAKAIQAFPASSCFKQFCAEHPYNLSFISNKEVQQYFKPFRLLYEK